MHSPWLDIPLADYEEHMALPEVAQAPMLADALEALARTEPTAAVAVLGCSGGNGIAALPAAGVTRVVAVDLHPGYVATAVARHGAAFAEFEAHGLDVLDPALTFAPVDLVFAGLLLEYVEVAPLLTRVAAWLRPGGRLGVVLQLPSPAQAEVTPSPYGRLASLAGAMQLREPDAVVAAAAAVGLRLEAEGRLDLPTGKAFAALTFRAQAAPGTKTVGGEDHDRAYAATPALFGDAPEEFLVTHAGAIPRPGVVLDVGAGQGRNTLYLAREGLQVHALDPSAEAVATVARAANRAGLAHWIETIHGSFEKAPTPARAYAAVLLFGLVQILTWEEIARLQAAVGRWLAPGGLVFLTAFTTEDPGYGAWATAGRELGPHSFRRPDGALRTFLTPGQAPSLFPGFEVVHHWEGLGPEHRHGDGAPERHGRVELVARR